MNDKAVYRTAPATPGLLNKLGKVRGTWRVKIKYITFKNWIMYCIRKWMSWGHRVSWCPGYATQSLSSVWITKQTKNITYFQLVLFDKNEKCQKEPFPSRYKISMKISFPLIFFLILLILSFWQFSCVQIRLAESWSVRLNPISASRHRWGQSERPGAAPSRLAQLHCSSKQCITHNGKYSNLAVASQDLSKWTFF